MPEAAQGADARDIWKEEVGCWSEQLPHGSRMHHQRFRQRSRVALSMRERFVARGSQGYEQLERWINWGALGAPCREHESKGRQCRSL